MEQYDKWQEYWDNYLLNKHGKAEVTSEDDLFFQVARTVQKKPVEKIVFDMLVKEIITQLGLKTTDVLIDFCCGNGLFTYELRNDAQQIIGVDFSAQIIEAAKRFKSAPNITYCLGGIIDFLKRFKTDFPGLAPDKYLMNDALAYFNTADLELMLRHIAELSPAGFDFALRGVPDDELKWTFYNTEERKQRYLDNVKKGDLTNDGLGRWWSKDEVNEVCSKLNLKCEIMNLTLPGSEYRMDIVISDHHK